MLSGPSGLLIDDRVIEHKSLNGAPHGRSEPPGESQEEGRKKGREGGRREEGMEGRSPTEANSLALDELQPSFLFLFFFSPPRVG